MPDLQRRRGNPNWIVPPLAEASARCYVSASRRYGEASIFGFVGCRRRAESGNDFGRFYGNDKDAPGCQAAREGFNYGVKTAGI